MDGDDGTRQTCQAESGDVVNSVPKYQAVHNEILRRLQSGQYAIGMRLPTEEELSATFKVSRVTVRKALELLVRSGFLTSRQGSGYNVATLSPPSSTCLVSFTDKVLLEGRVPGAKLLGIKVFEGSLPAAVAEFFDEPMVRVDRLRTVDDVPRMLTETWIPQRLVPDISLAHFPQSGQNQSLLRILRVDFQLDWSSACETIDCAIAEPTVAEQLKIPVNTPVLSQACTAFDGDGKPVFFDTLFRQGPISFDLAGPAPSQTNP